ncbi:MAG: diacylglycerol kinase [Sulfuricurvum sp. MLSB]|uniref:diacylglycerol kinase n=1 Tax=unclassified Sulfuricurvum TaxID=2632390 RepID=UPI0005052E30|nr:MULTISPECIES: diacylglycerol kinase [unclassified Sulfuricurvum]KFN40765.1 MAG: diacylglycerol kinase [Sulfuricurvum sp. MLSB]
MALNKPDYTLFKNTRYALNGLAEVTRNEKSFRLQLLLFVAAGVIAWVLPVSFVHHSVLFVSLFIPLMSEIINSAIERGVDLVTFEHHELAKRAKDAGAALVFVSFLAVGTIWALTLYDAFCV